MLGAPGVVGDGRRTDDALGCPDGTGSGRESAFSALALQAKGSVTWRQPSRPTGAQNHPEQGVLMKLTCRYTNEMERSLHLAPVVSAPIG